MTTTQYMTIGDRYLVTTDKRSYEGTMLGHYDSPSRGRTIELRTPSGTHFVPERDITNIKDLFSEESAR